MVSSYLQIEGDLLRSSVWLSPLDIRYEKVKTKRKNKWELEVKENEQMKESVNKIWWRVRFVVGVVKKTKKKKKTLGSKWVENKNRWGKQVRKKKKKKKTEENPNRFEIKKNKQMTRQILDGRCFWFLKEFQTFFLPLLYQILYVALFMTEAEKSQKGFLSLLCLLTAGSFIMQPYWTCHAVH